MSQTLVIHGHIAVTDLLNLNLPIYLGTDVVIKKDFKNSQVLIENHPGIHLIICADKVVEEATAELILKLNESLNKKIPVIVIGEKANLPTLPHVVILPGPDLKLILQTSAKFLKVTPKKMIEQVVPDFFPISITFCLKIKKAPCEIFLLKGEADYIKTYDYNDGIKTEDIQELISAGTEMIYVAAANRLKFVNHVTIGLLDRLKDSKLTDENQVSAAEEALAIVKDEAIKGETPASISTQELASAAISTCIEIAQKNPKIASLLKKLLANKSSVLYKHTQLIIHVSQHIITNLEWGSTEQKTKLAFVAFFHDICLTEDKYTNFRSDSAVAMEKTLSLSEKDLIINHAKLASEIVQKFPKAPIGADIIIMQHHGTTSGQGFAKTFTNSTSPLAIVFIIAEEFTNLILQYPEDTDFASKKDEMISRLNSIYTRSNYHKVIEILNTITF